MNKNLAKCPSSIWWPLLALAALIGPAVEVASARGSGQTVTLGWNFSANPNITNYNLYYGVASGVYTTELAVGVTNMAVVGGLVAGTNYFFVVTAVDANGMESAHSNETNFLAPISGSAPIITGQPASQTVLMGGQATFSVTASGTGALSYQWYFNGAPIGGATNSSLTLTGVMAAWAGNYSVSVINSLGSVLSSNAVLSLGTAPAIAVQPASQSVEAGCNAIFSVMATGTAPLSYQWMFNGMPLAAQTNASMSLANVQVSQFGNYSVVVHNALGVAASAEAVLALASPPTAETVLVHRFPQGGVRINVSLLLSNATSAMFDSLSVIAVSHSSAAGGAVTFQSPWIYYAPPAGEATNDSFTYTLSDGHCGTAVGTVAVTPSTTSPQPLNFAIAKLGDGALQLSFDGMPGSHYQLQYSESLSSPHWRPLTTQVADEFGVFRFSDPPVTNAPTRFYRAGWQPDVQTTAPDGAGKTIASSQ